MKPFFESLDRRIALRVELETWGGTPFFAGCAGKAKRGVGADCVSFVAAVLMNVGAIEQVEWPRYVIFGGGEEMLETLLKTMRSLPELKELALAPAELMVGDIFVMSGQKDYHHLSLMAEEHRVWHCTRRRGVCVSSALDPALRRNVVAVFRAYAE